MRIPLIVNHDPRLSLKGPVVFLSEGAWTLNSNHRNSIPSVIIGGSSFLINNDLRINGMQKVQVEFDRECRDLSVTIYAERV